MGWHNSVHGCDNFAMLKLVSYREQQQRRSPSPPSFPRPVCYVCLQPDGPMIVNVCDCRWSRVHPACLDQLVKSQAGSDVCRVCRSQFAVTIPPPSPKAAALCPSAPPIGFFSSW